MVDFDVVKFIPTMQGMRQRAVPTPIARFLLDSVLVWSLLVLAQYNYSTSMCQVGNNHYNMAQFMHELVVKYFSKPLTLTPKPGVFYVDENQQFNPTTILAGGQYEPIFSL